MRLFITSMLILWNFQIFAQQTVGLLKSEQGTYEGYTLFTARHYHTSYLINNEGKIINEWKQPDEQRVENCRLLDNGHLIRAVNLRLASFSRNPGAHGKLELVNWDGSINWSMVYGDETKILHHEIIPIKQEDGSYHFLASSWDKISASDAIANGRNPNAVGGNNNFLLVERLLEIEPVGSDDYNIVWEWSMMDHLVQQNYPSAGNYIENGVASNPQLMNFNYFKMGRNPDWNHVNGLDYNPSLDQIIISNPGSDEFLIIDHSTTTVEAAGHTGGNSGKGGDILYRWGNLQSYSVGSTKHFDALHGPYWIPEGFPDAGKIMVLNNGRNSTESKIEIISPDVDNQGNYNFPASGEAFGPQNSDWTYSNGSNFHTPNMGNGQRLPNGNTLINEAVKGRFFEIDTNGVIVWEYRCPVIADGPMEYDIELSDIPTTNAGGDLENEVFKILKYSKDFAGFDGKDLTAKGTIEIHTTSNIPNTIRDISDFTIYPNPANDLIKIKFHIYKNNYVKVQIASTTGHTLYSRKHQATMGDNEIEVQISSFIKQHNLVFVTLTQNNKTKTEKIVLIK